MNIKKMGYVVLDYLKNKAKRDGIVQFLELHVYTICTCSTNVVDLLTQNAFTYLIDLFVSDFRMNCKQLLVLVLVAALMVTSSDALLFRGRRGRRGRSGLGSLAAGIGLGLLGSRLLGGHSRPYYGYGYRPYGYGYGYPFGHHGGLGFGHHYGYGGHFYPSRPFY